MGLKEASPGETGDNIVPIIIITRGGKVLLSLRGSCGGPFGEEEVISSAGKNLIRSPFRELLNI